MRARQPDVPPVTCRCRRCRDQVFGYRARCDPRPALRRCTARPGGRGDADHRDGDRRQPGEPDVPHRVRQRRAAGRPPRRRPSPSTAAPRRSTSRRRDVGRRRSRRVHVRHERRGAKRRCADRQHHQGAWGIVVNEAANLVFVPSTAGAQSIFALYAIDGATNAATTIPHRRADALRLERRAPGGARSQRQGLHAPAEQRRGHRRPARQPDPQHRRRRTINVGAENGTHRHRGRSGAGPGRHRRLARLPGRHHRRRHQRARSPPFR